MNRDPPLTSCEDRAQVAAYHAWEQAGRPWLSRQEQEEMYYRAIARHAVHVDDESVFDANWPDRLAPESRQVWSIGFSINGYAMMSCRHLLPGALRFPMLQRLRLYVDESPATLFGTISADPSERKWEQDHGANEWLNRTWIPSLAA